jgi:HTH-type transcriptional regulator / antitoxin HigA
MKHRVSKIDANSPSQEFEPSWVSPPGDTIQDLLRARGMSSAQFAEAMQQTQEEVRDLIDGRLTLTIKIAQRLSTVIGASTQFWMSRDYLYRERAGRLQAESKDWLAGMPIGDMIRLGWITPRPRATEEAAAVLRFFDVSSLPAWRQRYSRIERLTAFRTSRTFESSPGAVAAWLREGERRASEAKCDRWDPVRFNALLGQIRTLTRVGDPRRFLPKLVELCATAGVIVVLLKAPTGCRASGATQFLASDRALLMLSFRHLTDDHFWFSFFHEAGHLLLHSQSSLFVEGLDEDARTTNNVELDDLFAEPEREANSFAEQMLIPTDAQTEFRALRADARSVLRFASSIGVSTGIVVGQLQHAGRVRRNQLNSLKRRYDWETGSSAARQPRKAR